MVLLRPSAIKGFIPRLARSCRPLCSDGTRDGRARCQCFRVVVKLGGRPKVQRKLLKMFLSILLLLSLTTQTGATAAPHVPPTPQTETHYRIYDDTGKALSMDDLLTALDMV